jgi:hypothetical protein
MDYRQHYDNLIARAAGRKLEGYVENHHILPRCMGGSNTPDNLVKLTAREHFVAHQLLCKIYPEVSGLIFAANTMTRGPGGHRVGNRKYQWLRERHAKATSSTMINYYSSVENRRRKGDFQKSKLASDLEYAAKLFAAARTPEARAKQRDSIKATLATPEGKARRVASAIEIGARPEQKALRSKLLKERHAAGDEMRNAARAGRTEDSDRCRLASFKKTLEQPEVRAKWSAAAKTRWETRDRKAQGEMLKASRVGKPHPKSRAVVQLLPNGFIVNEYPNMITAAKSTGHDKHTISDRVKRGHPLWVGV